MTRFDVTLDSIDKDTDLPLYLFLHNYQEVLCREYTGRTASFTCSAVFLSCLQFLLMEDCFRFNMTYRKIIEPGTE